MSNTYESVLDISPGEEWGGRFTHADGRVTSFSFASDVADSSYPSSMDGLVAVVLPAALRVGGRLRVLGPLSRTALRNLTELGEAWVSWRPDVYRPLCIEPAEVVDYPMRTDKNSALIAWSGSLRSTHTLIRHHDKLFRNGYDVRGVVRVWGLHHDERKNDADACLKQAQRVFEGLGIPFHVVRVQMDGDWLSDSLWGTQPWVAGSLHFLSGEGGAGLIARRWMWASQLGYPRPEPMVPDLWSGDTLSVRIDGGSASLPQMVAEIAAHHELAQLVSNCMNRPRHMHPCGRCVGCRLLSLAQLSCGMSPTAQVPGLLGIASLPLREPRWKAEAQSIVTDARNWSGRERKMLVRRLAMNRKRILWRNTARWLGSLTRVCAPWPR